MQMKEKIIEVIREKGLQDIGEYEQKIARATLTSELIGCGYDKEKIDAAIQQLCENGTLAMDEQDIYLYDSSVL